MNFTLASILTVSVLHDCEKSYLNIRSFTLAIVSGWKKNWTPIFIQMLPFLKIKPLIKLYLGILNKNISITYVLNEYLNCNAVMKMAKKIFHNHWTPDQSSFRPANSANSFSLKCTLFGFEATMLMVNVVCTYNLLYFSKTTTID